MANLRVFISLFVFTLMNACASVETALPRPSSSALAAEARTQEKKAFAGYQNKLARLSRVSSKILAANAPLCTKTRYDIGAITHTAKSYSKHLRAPAQRRLGVTEKPSVLHVRAGSPAAIAGIIKGDVFLGAKDKPASLANKPIQKQLENSAPLRILRKNKALSLQVPSNLVCGYRVQLKFSGAVNAYATGKSIIITTAMMDFAKTDQELALVVGHELAHNTMAHVRKIVQNVILSGFSRRAAVPFEAEADYVGLYYMARAGYELKDAELFWRRLGVRSPKNIVRAKTHPLTPARLLAIKMAAKEIAVKQKFGEKLTPNMAAKNE